MYSTFHAVIVTKVGESWRLLSIYPNKSWFKHSQFCDFFLQILWLASEIGIGEFHLECGIMKQKSICFWGKPALTYPRVVYDMKVL